MGRANRGKDQSQAGRYGVWCRACGLAPEDLIATPPAWHVEGSVSEELTGMMVAMLGSNCWEGVR